MPGSSLERSTVWFRGWPPILGARGRPRRWTNDPARAALASGNRYYVNLMAWQHKELRRIELGMGHWAPSITSNAFIILDLGSTSRRARRRHQLRRDAGEQASRASRSGRMPGLPSHTASHGADRGNDADPTRIGAMQGTHSVTVT